MGRGLRGAGGIVIGLTIVLASIGCSKSIDQAKLQTTITDKIGSDYGITLAEVTCPKDQKAKSGDTFQCSATTDAGVAVTFDIEQTNDDGAVTFTSNDVFATPEGLTDGVKGLLTAAGTTDATVTCPNGAVAPGGNGSISCKATSPGGGSSTVVVPIEDGTFDLGGAKLQ